MSVFRVWFRRLTIAISSLALLSMLVSFRATASDSTPTGKSCAEDSEEHAQLASRTSGAPLEVHRRLTDPQGSGTLKVSSAHDGVGFETISSVTSTQVIGVTKNRESNLTVRFEHMDCSQHEPLFARMTSSGVQIVDARGEPTYEVADPWAYDRAGNPIPTSFDVSDDGVLLQNLDTSRSVGNVYFDPTYTPITCSSGYYSDLAANQYLDLYGSSTDHGYCAPAGLFNARLGYLPVWAFETNVANDWGKIPVYQDGGCSWSPDTGWAWDFQVPCKAHDYCYDLRKAGFSGTVSDSDCDAVFWYLMEAHCNNRVFAGDCRLVRDTYYNAVSAPGVVTGPDPAAVSIKAMHSSKCADVTGASQSDNTAIVQYACHGGSNQKFKFIPVPGAPGDFWIRAEHSQKCADVNAQSAKLTQWGCGNYFEQRFKLNGTSGTNIYVIKSRENFLNKCWDVPGSSQANSIQLQEFSCNETSNQRWILA
jgi:hypothetical protein